MKDKELKALNRAIDEYCLQKGLGYAELASEIGISAGSFANIRSGSANPRALTLRQIYDTIEYDPNLDNQEKNSITSYSTESLRDELKARGYIVTLTSS